MKQIPTILLAVTLWSTLSVAFSSASDRPNILLVFTDDHAYQAISAYGSRINQTPNIDRLAIEGMRFDNCYVTNSICGPCRATMLTGKYSHKNGFVVPYHLLRANNDNVADTLSAFVHNYGAPETLVFDGAAVQVGSKTRFQDIIRRTGIKHHVSGPRRPNENAAEAAIREVKKRWYRIMAKENIPARLWDFGITWVSALPAS